MTLYTFGTNGNRNEYSTIYLLTVDDVITGAIQNTDELWIW